MSPRLSFLSREICHIAIMQAVDTELVSEKIGKVMADDFFTALAAFLFGRCLAGTIKRFDADYLAGSICSGVFVIFGIFWTGRAVQRLLTAKYTTSETAKRSARQLVAYCIAFVASSATFGLEVMGGWRQSSDGFYSFSAGILGIITCAWFLNVYRGARRLTSALV
jgi:hypothetical protein